MNTRRFALAAGVLAVALGVVFVVAPGFAGAFGANRTGVVALGVVALLLAVRGLNARRKTPRESASLSEVESRVTFDRPGAAVTDRARAAARGRMNRDARHVRDALRDVAVDVLTTYGEYTTEEAADALDAGTWTDDPHAAALFARTAPGRPLRLQIRDVFAGTAAFDRRVTRAAEELAALVEEA
ncbi:hypothetical protein [Salarchaeum sp. JOR-1]|uniref:DUF7269 family protein n=1 Tax=Salarchaeum sp. JOR-1 TaxID=2599399 RepID=UPI0011985D33|nr:hypothetical protein [Salarchaeum sp. JOR-1]QDX39829.1 hypothetical protein FQU85_02535 [Salarchaeum sp. JOR-1]